MPTREEIIEALKLVKDPELDLDVWFLGLIYKIDIQDQEINIEMTLTSPMCPLGPEMMDDVRFRIKSMGVEKVNVKLVFSPPWEPSEEVKAMMGLI